MPTRSPPPHPARRWLPLPVLLAALFVVMLYFLIVNVALPSMALSDGLDATQQNVSKHLGVLHSAGMLRRRREGRSCGTSSPTATHRWCCSTS